MHRVNKMINPMTLWLMSKCKLNIQAAGIIIPKAIHYQWVFVRFVLVVDILKIVMTPPRPRPDFEFFWSPRPAPTPISNFFGDPDPPPPRFTSFLVSPPRPRPDFKISVGPRPAPAPILNFSWTPAPLPSPSGQESGSGVGVFDT